MKQSAPTAATHDVRWDVNTTHAYSLFWYVLLSSPKDYLGLQLSLGSNGYLAVTILSTVEGVSASENAFGMIGCQNQ